MNQVPFEKTEANLPEGTAQVASNGQVKIILMPDLVAEGVELGRRRANKPGPGDTRYMAEWGIVKFADGLRIYVDADRNVIVTRQELYP
ncbi:MAG TPA: hypothetical protein PLJ74_12030 [Myxococcota bacterium]|nr:hypothetical protein [Myxococcota bacterium]